MSVKLINTKVIAGLLVLGVISIIIFSGPAKAFVLSLQITDNSVTQGDKIKVNLKVDTENGDSPTDISFLIFKMNGPENIVCNFSSDGTLITGCEGIEITKKHTTDTGYCKSYGYGYGCSLEFDLTIDSGLFEVGTYATTLIINAKEKNTEKKGDNIIISSVNKVCSVRANGGTIISDEINFTKNKINFFIPISKAEKGQGYLSGQDGKGIFLYKFSVDRLLFYTNELVKAEVSGKFRIGNKGVFADETAILTFDRIQNVTSLVGNDVNMTGMKVYFRKFC